MTPGLLLLFALLALTAGVASGPWFPQTWLTLTLTGAVAGLAAALMVLLGTSFYILYVAAGLVALGVLVFFGGAP